MNRAEIEQIAALIANRRKSGSGTAFLRPPIPVSAGNGIASGYVNTLKAVKAAPAVDRLVVLASRASTSRNGAALVPKYVILRIAFSATERLSGGSAGSIPSSISGSIAPFPRYESEVTARSAAGESAP